MYSKLSSSIWNMYVNFSWFYLVFVFEYDFLLVPNDEEDNEDEDTVFMPIKSNDDDEPVGFKKRNKMIVIIIYLID